MKWIGAWILSVLVWLVIALAEVLYREAHGESYVTAINEGRQTLKVGWALTGLILLGVWCIWFS